MKSKVKRRKGLKAKKYNLGGYFDPNGDPTKKPGKAVAESTAVPNYTEQAFLNYARLIPQVQTPYFRDEGTIRPTPENEPDIVDWIWEGTPLGQTEYERLAPQDQMSLLDVMAEPLKALEYYSFDANRGRLPTRAEWDSFGSPNPMDNALFMYNPAAQISFAHEDEAGGLSAFTGIGKIGNVVRDAFNTGDDILRISAENISKQGQKMTQKHLAQQINKSPLVDLEEAVYNPEIISIDPPGFGISKRYRNNLLGQPGGRLGAQLQKQHVEDYGMIATEYSGDIRDAWRDRGNFNITKDGNNLPITRSISHGGSYSFYKPGNLISGSVPQIKPLQAGGELEKFVKKDGTINLNEVSNFVSTSKSISPADRFILNQAISKMDVNQPYDYIQFKGNVSQYIPRMTVRSTDKFSALGVRNIFPDHDLRNQGADPYSIFEDPDPTKFTAESVIISESNLPTPISSNAGMMRNYMLNNDTDIGMHFDPVKDPNLNTLGSHSHYRVARLTEQPEVSYFLELQSDALAPKGYSNYNNMINEGKNAHNSAIPKLIPANIGQWHIDDLSGQQLTRNRTPLGVLQLLRRDYGYYPDYYPNEFADIIRENKDVFPIDADGLSTFSDEDLDRFNFITQKKAEKLFQQLGPDQFNKVFDNSIEPRVIDYHDKFLTPTDLYDGLSPLQFNITNIGNHMNNIREMLNPDGKFMMEARKSPEAYQNSINELKNRYKDASFQVSETFENVEELKNYLDYKAQDFIDFNDNIKDFLQEHDDILLHNSYLDGLQIDRGDFLKLDRIRQEVRDLTREAGVANLDLITLQHDAKNISKALDFYSADVFPLEDTQLGLTTAFSDQQDKLNNIGWMVEGLTTGKDLLTGNSFKEVVKNLPDLKPLADRYNRLIEDFEKELKIFRDKYLPVSPGGMENPVSQLMKKRPERRIIGEALHGPHNNLYNRFPTEETSRKIQSHPAIGEENSEKFDAVHRKYKNMEKTLKAMGYEPKLVTDSYGNTWWEVKATSGMIHGTAEYDAYWKGGRIGLKKKRNSMIRLVKR